MISSVKLKNYSFHWEDVVIIVGVILCFCAIPLGIYVVSHFEEIHNWLNSNQHLRTIQFISYFCGGVLLYLQFVMANKRARAMEKSVQMQAESNELIRQGQSQ